MPQTLAYRPAAPAVAQPPTGKQLPLKMAPTKNITATTLTTATPLSRPANAPAPRSVAGSSAVPSLTSDSSSDASGDGSRSIDLLALMDDKLSTASSPLPMDRTIAKQAQASGALNAKQRELLELQALAQRRLKTARKNLADGVKVAKEVKRDLEWTQKTVNELNLKASQKHSAAFKAASARAPARRTE